MTKAKKTCYACAHSYMEPDSPYLICGHEGTQSWAGTYIKQEPLPHCNWKSFKQHPLRKKDGSLKSEKVAK